MDAQIIKNRLRKIFAYTFTGLVFVLLSSFLLLQIPPVQQSFINRFLGDFSKVTSFSTSVGSFRMLWFDRLELDQVLIKDSEGNHMIAVKNMRINFKLFEMLNGKNVNIDGVTIDGAEVYLKSIAESDTSQNININIFINQINEHYAAQGGGGGSPAINIGEAILQKSKFRYDDGATTKLAGFDYHHFTLDIPDAELNKFMILGDTIEFNVASMLVEDQKTHLKVNDLSTFFRLSAKSMEFYNLSLQAGNSRVSDTLIFKFNSQLDLSDFNDKVDIDAHFKNTVLHPQDLELFAVGASKLGKSITLSGHFKGRVNKFSLKNMTLQTGQSELHGELNMDGLPYLDETFIELELDNSKINFNDLDFALNETVIDRLKPLGATNLSGQFLGYVNDFVANGLFQTKLGVIKSDINLKINDSNAERSTYSGNLDIKNFDLGTYLSDTISFQRVTLTGNIKGSGLARSTADFILDGTIESIGIMRYDYQNINTNARFASDFFNGKISINDPNAKASLNGSIDLRKGINKVQLIGTVDTLNLQQVKLSRDQFSLSTDVNINTQGFVLDSLKGIGVLTNLALRYRNRDIKLKEIDLKAESDRQLHTLTLATDLFEASAKGNFYYSDLFEDIQVLINELKLNIENDAARINDYYKITRGSNADYAVDLDIHIKDMAPISNLLNINLSLSRDVKIEGNFTKGITTMLHVYSDIPKISFNNFIFENTNVEVNTSKLKDSTAVLAMLFIRSDKQRIQNIDTENLITEAIWNKNHVDFNLDIDQQRMTNNLRLRGTVDFTDSTYISLQNTTFKLLEDTWKVNNQTQISQKGKEWHLQNVGFSNEEQSINLRGHVSTDETLPLIINLNNISLSSFESLITEKLKGLVNAEFSFKNIYGNTTLENKVKVDSLTINNFLVGNINAVNEWDNIDKRFLVDVLVNRQGLEAINLNGYYDPANNISPLNIDAKLNKADLRLAEPVFRGLFSQIDGTVTGDFLIKGTLNKPQIRGIGKIENGQIMIDYLKTLYRFTGNIGMTPTTIYFENITMTDAFNNKGKLEGFIAHRNFDNMRINLDGSFTNFMVLNTTAKDNSLFYGQGFATGKVNFFGPVSNLKISSTAKTERNTRLYIPLNSTGSVEKKEFISFVNFKDTTKNKATDNNRKKLTGVAIDLNLDITEDAYCEIIFDIKAGDIIRGRGNGDIRLQLDTKGEFNMFGGMTFVEGGYNFTLYNLINKEFEIEKGSQITWSGDPYLGQMNIRAAYNQLASIAPIILDTESQSDPVLRRKYPLKVLLTLEGAMLSPQIGFDIIAKDLPQSVTLTNGDTKRLAFEFAAFKTKLDEQELKKQVFSLIILRRLSPLNETISTSGSVTNSVSELLSNQLSYWMSQVDENLEIDVDLGALDAEAFNTFQLRLSYTFLNGRLRITRDGTFTNQNSATTQTNSSASTAALVGDWTVDYLLTADGKFKVRMYNRTNTNAVLNALNNQNAITTGVSVQHTQSFNTLSDLWRSARKRKEEEKELLINDEAIIKEEETIQENELP